MKKDRLEDFVKANRGDFDFREPSPELWSRIAKNTPVKKVIPMRAWLFRAAAVLLVALVTSVAVWQSGMFNSKSLAKNADPEMLELMETEAWYSQQVNQKLKEIQKCYYTNPELKDDIEADLNELEGMYKVLKGELNENISNRSVIEAMIENNRYRLKICDDVLEQVKC